MCRKRVACGVFECDFKEKKMMVRSRRLVNVATAL